eukprot:3255143-Amphidinium_carterae.1
MREKRNLATSCPPPLSQQRFDTLVARSRLEVRSSEPLSVVARNVLKAREMLQGHALAIRSDAGYT